ncbi:MAG: hypothetical protein ACK4SA_13050 [Caldilinea sp.]
MANDEPFTHNAQSGCAPSPGRRTHTFVLRLVVDAEDDLHGLVSEPGADDGWRPGFTSLRQLSGILERRLQIGCLHEQEESDKRRDR